MLTRVNAKFSGLLFDGHLMERWDTIGCNIRGTLFRIPGVHHLLLKPPWRKRDHWLRHLAVVLWPIVPCKGVGALWWVWSPRTGIGLWEGQTWVRELPMESRDRKRTKGQEKKKSEPLTFGINIASSSGSMWNH